MLNKKVSHKKLRPKAKKEPKFLKWLHEVKMPSCYVCGINTGVEIHHIKAHSTDERIDSIVLPLCCFHHHGSDISPDGTPRKFRDKFSIHKQKEDAKILYMEYIN